MKFNVDTSREIRQWVKMAISGLSTIMMIDYLANDGNGVKKVVNSIKEKTNHVKTKIGEAKSNIIRH